MSFYIISLTLFAALLHASWNALLRGGGDKLWSMTIMCLAVAAASAATAVFLTPPSSASWKYAILSALLHVGYNLFLVQSYKVGDFGQTYPIARGSSPILITMAAAIFAGERISASALVGIALVSGGIISMSFMNRKTTISSLPYALGTGCFIAAYSVADGIGVRLSGAPLAYTVWMCALWGVLMPAVYIALRDARHLFTMHPGFFLSFVGGLISLLAYGIIIYAMSRAPMGAVSALRENGVFFATLIGYFFLGETLTVRKMMSCVAIVAGTITIG